MNTATVSHGAPSNTAKWLALAAAFMGWMFDGLEMGLFPLVARPAMMEMMGPQAMARFGTWMSIIIAMFLVGAALGGVAFGWLGDRIGRTRAMVWSVLAYSLFSGLCAFAVAPWQIAGLRFLAALGMGGEWALGVALVMEIWPGKSRPLMAGLIGAAANVGFLSVALMSLALQGIIASVGSFLHAVLPDATAAALLANGAWRMLFLLGATPAFLTLFIRVFVPESEAWHAAVQKNRVTPRVGDLFGGSLLRRTLVGSGLGAVALLGTWGSVQWIPSWGHKLAGGAAGARETLQIWSAVGAILFSILVGLVAEKLNRRMTYFLLCLVTLAACAVLFRVPMTYGPGLFFWTFLVGGLSAGFYGWLPLYLPELFPTRLRATGSGFTFNIGRVLAAGGTLGAGALLNAFNEDYARMCSVISLVYVAGMILIWFGPETKGKALPE
ncbi:MAG TPA: MFS transporter [Fibrobacteria bacterium]|jgi:MFS family permease|nr:MFS transporter [Fibrobacteria bacterium]